MPAIQDWRSSLFVVLAATCACTDTERNTGVQEQADDQTRVTILTGANLIDGTELLALAGATIVVEGARITCIGTADVCPEPEGSERHDLLRGRTNASS